MSCNLLIIDTETTGLEPNQHQVIELGAVLYSVEHQTTLHQLSTLIFAPDNPQERRNCIPSSVLPYVSDSIQTRFLRMFMELVDEADFAVAHNVEFDRQWFNDNPLPVLYKDMKPMQWLCTMTDFTFPHQNRFGESLVNLALSHGIGVSSAHRALTDCQLIAALFDRMDDLEAMVNHALRPKALYKALVSYDDRQLAKDAGFQWNSLESKAWARKMAEEDIADLPFQVVKVRNL